MSDSQNNALPPNNGGNVDDEESKKIEAAVADRLAKMKTSMDSLDAKLKQEQTARAAAEAKANAAEVARLEAEGKAKEAAELRIKQLEEDAASLRARNVELTRDNSIRAAIGSFEFQSAGARNSAISQINGQLREQNGDWVFADGSNIETGVQRFLKAEENQYLLKPKNSSGTGQRPISGEPPQRVKKLSEMTQAEVLERARQGQLPRQRK